jgi:hypothetical protein
MRESCTYGSARGGGREITRVPTAPKGLPHAAAKATEAAASEATEAATAAPRGEALRGRMSSSGRTASHCASRAVQLGEMGPPTGQGDFNYAPPQKICAQF